MNDKIVTRFAPSPTGYLHLGHAYSAILNYDRAKKSHGRFLLRIEDIDHGRCKPECETAIYEDLAWLGLDWETPVRRQSERLHIYESKLKEMADQGLVYRCFKTRKDIEEAMSAPHAAGEAFRGQPLPPSQEQDLIAQGAQFAWRLSMDALAPAIKDITYIEEMDDGALVERPANANMHGDVVLGRKDIGTSYHLACVMDDADQGVILVIRGAELADFAGLHAILFRLFGHEAPVFHHHRFITNENGERLAKRDQSITLRTMRQQGLTPDDIRARLPL